MIKLRDILREQSFKTPETLEQIWDGQILKFGQGDSNLIRKIQTQVFNILKKKDPKWVIDNEFRPDGDFGTTTSKAIAKAINMSIQNPQTLNIGPSVLNSLQFPRPEELSLNIRILAATITGEAMGSFDDMQAVANIILNRSIARNMKPTAVALERKQFSMWNQIAGSSIEEKTKNIIMNWGGGLKSAGNLKYWKYGIELAKQIQNKTLIDNTGGATHYFTGSRPYWAEGEFYVHHKDIGKHEYGRDSSVTWGKKPVKR